MNKYLTLGLIVVLPLITLTMVVYYSDYGVYLRYTYKCEAIYQRAYASGGALDEKMVVDAVNPELEMLLAKGYLKFYYQEFSGKTDSPEMLSFWNQAREIAGSHSPMRFFSLARTTDAVREELERNDSIDFDSAPFYVYFITKEPEYSQLKETLDSSMAARKIESVNKSEVFGYPYSYWAKLSNSSE